MKVLVTGGTGVVGRSAVDHLLERGHAVRLLCRDAEHGARAWSGVEAHDGSVERPGEVRGSADGCEAVLHVAGIAVEDPPEVTFESVNVEGTRTVVREAARAGVRRFVYVSSLGAEHGESGYHRSKLAAEAIVRAEFPGEWLVIRPGNVYGPGDEVISLLLKMVRTLPVIPVVGNGKQPFQPVWVEDLGRALARAVEADVPARQTLPVAGPDRTTTHQLADLLERITDRHPPRLPVPEWLAKGGVAVAERLGSPLPVTADQIRMLQEGNVIEPPEQNALLPVFGVTPTPLADGLALLADALPERSPSDGIGAMHRQRYWADIRGSRQSAGEMLRMFRENFAEITPDVLLEVGTEPGTPTALQVGQTVTMTIPLRGHVQVRIEEITERAITCATLAGHHLFGMIRFGARERAGRVHFEIRSYTRAATVVDLAAWASVGQFLQRATWTETVAEVVRRSGGEAEGGVQTEQRTLDERDAERVERWADELVMRRRRAESPAAPVGPNA